MLFNSYLFILCFLPLTLAGFYILSPRSKRAAQMYLLAMSLWFYGYYDPVYLLLICGSIAGNYIFSRLLQKDAGRKTGEEYRGSKALLAAAVISNVALIFYFKYYDFFISNVNSVFKTDFVLKHILLPLGISFFTFQQISFIADSWKGLTKDYSLLEYALFVTYFPQLVAGPIVLHNEIIPQFRTIGRNRPDTALISRGIMLFTLGLSKKVLIADWLGKAVDHAYGSAASASSAELMIAVAAYTLQIYFDFSGYSDMAVGLGAMFGFTLPINFDSPYQSLSVPEFWRRWHMTLGRFLQKYIYIPLGGNRKGPARTFINTMITFAVSGLWHGANFTFILWGLLHGLGVGTGRLIGRYTEKIPKALRWAFTYLFVTFAFGLFRADSVGQYGMILKKIFTGGTWKASEDFLSLFKIPNLRYLMETAHIPYTDMAFYGFSAAFVLIGSLLICLLCGNNYKRVYKTNALTLAGTLILLTMCLLSLSRVSVFLYFNF